MTEDRQPVRVAVNVMRARLTVVGFNLTIIALQLSRLQQIPGGIEVPSFDYAIHLETSVALLLGMALSIFAMISFIASCALDKEGTCNHWSLVAGDLFMYLALAHTVSGFFGPIIFAVGQVKLDAASQMADWLTVRDALAYLGGGAWFAAMYLGPAVSLLRSPFSRHETISLGAAYVVLVLVLAHVSVKSVEFEMARDPTINKPQPTMLNELIQPFRW